MPSENASNSIIGLAVTAGLASATLGLKNYMEESRRKAAEEEMESQRRAAAAEEEEEFSPQEKAALGEWEKFKHVDGVLNSVNQYIAMYGRLKRQGKIVSIGSSGEKKPRHSEPNGISTEEWEAMTDEERYEQMMKQARDTMQKMHKLGKQIKRIGCGWGWGENNDYTFEEGPLKGEDRIKEKQHKDYGGDLLRVIDVVRCSVVVEDTDPKTTKDFIDCFREGGIFANDWEVVRIKDGFQNPDNFLRGGYRDIKLNVRCKATGHIVEIQVHNKDFYELKRQAGHKHYEYSRTQTISAMTRAIEILDTSVPLADIFAAGKSEHENISDNDENQKLCLLCWLAKIKAAEFYKSNSEEEHFRLGKEAIDLYLQAYDGLGGKGVLTKWTKKPRLKTGKKSIISMESYESDKPKYLQRFSKKRRDNFEHEIRCWREENRQCEMEQNSPEMVVPAAKWGQLVVELRQLLFKFRYEYEPQKYFFDPRARRLKEALGNLPPEFSEEEGFGSGIITNTSLSSILGVRHPLFLLDGFFNTDSTSDRKRQLVNASSALEEDHPLVIDMLCEWVTQKSECFLESRELRRLNDFRVLVHSLEAALEKYGIQNQASQRLLDTLNHITKPGMKTAWVLDADPAMKEKLVNTLQKHSCHLDSESSYKKMLQRILQPMEKTSEDVAKHIGVGSYVDVMSVGDESYERGRIWAEFNGAYFVRPHSLSIFHRFWPRGIWVHPQRTKIEPVPPIQTAMTGLCLPFLGVTNAIWLGFEFYVPYVFVRNTLMSSPPTKINFIDSMRSKFWGGVATLGFPPLYACWALTGPMENYIFTKDYGSSKDHGRWNIEVLGRNTK